MMLRHSFDLGTAADAIETAVAGVLSRGILTADIAGAGGPSVNTAAMGDAIVAAIMAAGTSATAA
jgi:3-isopropylmalate dehydrogenase